MDQKYSFVIATGIFSVIYMSLIVPVALWPHESLMFSFFWVSLYGLLACSLSVDFVELVLTLFWTHRNIPVLKLHIERQKTAIVMTICDDSDAQAILELIPLAQSGYPVFILDDSKLQTYLSNELRGLVTYCYRKNKKGAKAGNLNNWVKRFGNKFENIVILDSDSTISVKAVDKLVRAADHPTNNNIAVFQSKIAPRMRCRKTLLSYMLGLAARPRTRVIECVHSRLGLIISFGHNQLIRLSALKAIGGFSEQFSSEDTALTLSLSEIGLKTELVDVWSYDTEPESISAYVRRTVRWARQTVEIFHGDWSGCPLSLKLLLCRHLISYILPAVGFILLLISICRGPSSIKDVLFFLSNALLLKNGYAIYGAAIMLPIAILLSRLLFQFHLAIIEGVPLLSFLLSMIVAPSLQAILLFPVTAGIILSILGFKVRFIPTNSNSNTISANKRFCQKNGLPFAVGFMGLGLLSLVAFRPGGALVGFNFIWLLGFTLAPLVAVALSFTSSENKEVSVMTKGTE